MPTDARSTHEDLPVPHPDNDVNEDMPRVGVAIEAIGTKIHDVKQTLADKAATAHTHEISAIEGLQSALNVLSDAVSGLSTPALNDLDDVNVSSATPGMVLLYIADAWQAAKIAAANVVVGSSDVEAELTALSDAITSLVSSLASLTSAVGQKANSADLGDLAGKDQVGTGDLNTSEVKAALGLGYETRIVDGKAQFKDGSTWKDIDGEALTKADANESAIAALVEKVPGIDQTWQDMTASRMKNTVYQNTTPRQIEISIGFNVGGIASVIEVSLTGLPGSFIQIANRNRSGNSQNDTLQASIPPGHFYQYDGQFDISFWMERR